MENKTAYICSRYSADTKEQFDKQMQMTQEFSREAVLSGYAVIVPPMYYPCFLDDNNKEERQLGLDSAIRLLHKCDIVFVYIGLGVSSGMEAEIEEARRVGKQIYFFENMNTMRDILKRLEI